ncbi:MAG: hypothetical protein KJ579_11555 [Verrucomicrobia bacterium]|nr:hypothetical protein [Verrucomicrobiota bacterium]
MTTRPSTGRLLQSILIVSVAVLAFAWWRQRQELMDVRTANERLARAGESGTPRPGSGTAGTPSPAPAAPLAAASAPSQVLTPAGMASAPRTDGLVLDRTRVASDATGLHATMRFRATTTDPLGNVSVVVRLPRNSEGRILDLGPANGAAFASAMKQISEDGRFAVYQGTADRMDAVEFALSVSAAVTADVRGTCGIGPFDLAISADKAAASPK